MSSDEILSIEEISERLKDRRLYVVAEQIGVSYGTLIKIRDNKDKSVNSWILKAVSDYLQK